MQPVADLAGAGERDGLERRRLDQRLPQFAAGAGHEIDHAFGQPASCSASTMRQALSGAAEAGLSTTVLPQISAGASFHAGMALGKFHGVTSPTTPMGLRMREHVHAIALGRHQQTIEARALAGEIPENVDGAADLAFGLGQGLAFLAGHVGRHLIEAAIEDVGGLKQKRSARAGRSCATRRAKREAAAPAASSISRGVPLVNSPTISPVLAGLRFSNCAPPCPSSGRRCNWANRPDLRARS
jgi:hypothetical protein